MNTIIIYATKYGCTEKVARMLKSEIGDNVVLVNSSVENIPDIDEYHNVIIGGSIYISKIQKNISDYVKQNVDKLLTKRVGLFICAGTPEQEEKKKELKEAFPQELHEHCIIEDVLGDAIYFEKLKFFDRIIVKGMQNIKESYVNIPQDRLKAFAKKMI